MKVHFWVSLFTGVCAVAGIDRQISSEKVSSDTDFCTSPGCYHAGLDISSYLNESVNPCDDFYQFACGGWMNKTVIPGGKNHISVFSKLQDAVTIKFKELLDLELKGNEPDFIRKIKRIYDTCMDYQSFVKESSKPLRKVLKKLGRWPVIEEGRWHEDSFHWICTLVHFHDLGYSHDILFELSVIKDPMDSSVNIIKLDQPSFGIKYESLVDVINDGSKERYAHFMENLAHILRIENGFSVKRDWLVNEMNEALSFEVMLANISSQFKEKREGTNMYERYTVQKLIDNLPQVNWLYYFQSILKVEINESEPFVIHSLDFLKKIVDLITKTNKRVLANYMLWRIVHQSYSLYSINWSLLDFNEFPNSRMVEPKKAETDPNWRRCISFLRNNLGTAVNSYYLRHYIKEESEKSVQSLTEYIRKAFINLLSNANWMEETTKRKALEKADAIQCHLEYETELRNDTFVSDIYKNLQFNGKSYFHNALNVSKWLIDNSLSRLRRPDIKSLMKYETPFRVKLSYDHMENSIVIPLGMFQDPIFSNDKPNYLNFGALGSLIGRELLYAFVDKGRQFDKNSFNSRWWSKNTNENFKEKTQCFIQHYRNYIIEKRFQVKQINMKKIQDDVVAVNGGLKAAYWAYRAWVADHQTELKPLALNHYTQNQFFWISAANVLCEKSNQGYMQQRIRAGAVISQKFRVIGSMSNLPEFVQDFRCSLSARMNRRNKCQVW